MTVPEKRRHAGWEDLTPWDKAAEWHNAAPHIADELMRLTRDRAEHYWTLERDKAAHDQKMDVRTWITQVIALIVGMVNVAVLAVVAWHYADTGQIVPGLTVLGAGAGLTIGAYGAGRVLANKIAK